MLIIVQGMKYTITQKKCNLYIFNCPPWKILISWGVATLHLCHIPVNDVLEDGQGDVFAGITLEALFL